MTSGNLTSSSPEFSLAFSTLAIYSVRFSACLAAFLAASSALISFLTAWSVFAFHRVLAYELPLMGMKFVRIRLLASLILPPLAGVMAAALVDVFHWER